MHLRALADVGIGGGAWWHVQDSFDILLTLHGPQQQHGAHNCRISSQPPAALNSLCQ